MDVFALLSISGVARLCLRRRGGWVAKFPQREFAQILTALSNTLPVVSSASLHTKRHFDF